MSRLQRYSPTQTQHTLLRTLRSAINACSTIGVKPMIPLLTVTLSNNISVRVQKLAKQQDEDTIAIVERILDEALPETFDEQAVDDSPEADPADREMAAYIALHPQLKDEFFGQHVAIYGGKLIDHDTDRRALYLRIVAQYPDEFVWLSKVEEEPIRTLVFRSPRFDRG